MLRCRTLLLAGVALVSLSMAACGSDSLSGSATEAAKDSTASASSAVDAAVSADPALVAKLPEKIASAGKIVVGTDATYAPNEFLDTDGKTVIGMDVDLFDAVAAKFGVTVEYQPADFSSVILGVAGGKFDVGVSSLTINDERKQQVDMVSYFDAGTQWVVPTGNPKDVDPDNACGLSVGVQKGTVQIDDITARNKDCVEAGKPEINLVVQEGQDQVTADVVSGKTAAMLADSPVSLYAVQQTNGQIEALGGIYDAAPYGFVVPKGQEEFAQAIADALTALHESGDYEKVLADWNNVSGGIDEFLVNP